jgi:hypothetical protein
MSSTSTFVLTPSECRQARETLSADCSAERLLERLEDAESLAVWLRDQVRVELPLEEAAKMRGLHLGATV